MVIEHERAIQMVCRRCCSKASKTAKPITPMIKEKFKDVFNTNLDYDTPYHPKVLCPTCYRCLHQDQANDRKLPQGYDFTFHHTRKFTENCTSGQCEVCNVANTNPFNQNKIGKNVVANKKASVGRPAISENKSPNYSLHKCCGAKKGPGFRHNCSKTNAASNFKEILKKRKIEEPVAAKIVRKKSG